MKQEHKILAAFIILSAILFSACTANSVCEPPEKLIGDECCIDRDADSSCDVEEVKNQDEQVQDEMKSNEEAISDKNMHNEEERQNTAVLLPDRNFSIEQLSAEISRITGYDELLKEHQGFEEYTEALRKKGHKIYTNNNQYKTWVVEVINKEEEQIDTTSEFYDYVNARDWDGWRYYVNETWWKHLRPPISESELKEILPDYKYKAGYFSETQSNWVDHDIRETVKETPDGRKMLQHDMTTLILTPEKDDGYWIGNWEPFFLIYKIPCTKDMIIYYRARYDKNDEGRYWNKKKSEVIKDWEREISAKLPEIKDEADQLMEFCGISKEHFEQSSFIAYENSEKLVHNWKVYYATLYNYSISVNGLVKREHPNDDKFTIDHLNISFTNNEDEPYLWILRVYIEIEDRGREGEYGDFGLISSKPKQGHQVRKTISVDHEHFLENATLVLKPYFGYEQNTEHDRYYLKTERIPLNMFISK